MNHAVFELFPCLLRAKQSKDQGNDLMEHLARMQTLPLRGSMYMSYKT